jgi:hypothetical protein
VRPQRVRLEHHADVAVVGAHVDSAGRVVHDTIPDADPPLRALLEAGDKAQGRRLPAPAGAEQHEQLAIVDRDRQIFDSNDGSLRARELLTESFDLESCHGFLQRLRSGPDQCGRTTGH